MTIHLTFSTWEEFDNAIGGIVSVATALANGPSVDDLDECARCGQDVSPLSHPEIGCDF